MCGNVSGSSHRRPKHYYSPEISWVGLTAACPLRNTKPCPTAGFFYFPRSFPSMAMPTRRIEIYDTTLRDGTQGEGFNLSLQDKLQIAQKLDFLGVDYIEGGFPLSNPKDAAFFREIGSVKLKTAKISAFGMTRRRGMKAEDDPGMKALARRANARRHDRRQDQRISGRESPGGHAGGKSGDDRRDDRGCCRSAGRQVDLRCRAFLRRLSR